MPKKETIHLARVLIHMFEGVKLTAYQDSGKVWTIGFGHTKDVAAGQTITMSQAEEFFEQDAAPLFAAVENKPPVEAAALVCFGFNCGLGAMKRVISGDITVEVDGFYTTRQERAPYGIRAGTQVLQGLKTRRAIEAALIGAARAT